MKKQNVLSCQFSSWFETFKPVTFRSRLLDIPKDVIKYLLADGLVLPEGCEETWDRAGLQGDSDDEVDWSQGNASIAKAPNFPDFQQKMKDYIAELGGKVYPKLNWSSPKDAVWISFDNTMMCTCPRDVWLLLKSSDFVTHDLTKPFSECVDYNEGEKTNIQYQLILRKWVNVVTGMEFRCFVYDKSLIAICQRDHTTYYSYIETQKIDIIHDIVEFFNTNIRGKFPEYDYVFDVYRKNKGEILLVDFSPFGPVTDGLLFDWDELNCSKMTQSQASNSATNKVPVFRYVQSRDQVQGNPYAAYKVPQDFVHLSTGEDPSKLVDILKGLKTRAPEGLDDESSDEDSDPSIQENPFKLPS